MTQFNLTADAWTLIAGPGVSGACWLDEDSDGSAGTVGVRILSAASEPALSDATKGRRVWKPNGNSDVCQFSPKDDTFSTWAICRATGDKAVISVDESVGTLTTKMHPFNTELDGSVRVSIQDRPQEIVSIRMCEKLADITLAVNGAIDDQTIQLAPGHGVVANNIICLKQSGRFYQGIALSVATNVITLDTPLDFAFTTAAVSYRSSSEMNVNGSSARRIFSVAPPAGTAWHIYGMDLAILDNDAMDDSKFGGLTALTKGVFFRQKDGIYKNIFNVKTNGEFALRASGYEYSSKAPAGFNGLNAELKFTEHNGVVIFLDGDTSDELQLIIQDDLTGLTSFKATVSGHVVTA